MKRLPVIPLFLLLLLFLIPASASLGAADIDFGMVMKALLSRLFPGRWDIPPKVELILFSIRLPRVILAGITGAGLGISGVVFQGVFRNPLAEPYLLGVSSGAALGATLAIVFGIQLASFLGSAAGFFTGTGFLAFFAFLGAMITALLVFFIAGRRRQDFSVLLLGGIALGYLFQALISFLMMLFRSDLDRIVFWMMGSFSSASWEKVGIAGLFVLVVSIFLGFNARSLNALSLGSENAHSLGVNPSRTGNLLLAAASLVTAVVVSVSGIIGFVGLLVPHLVRLLSGPDHRRLLPASAAGGAVLLILSDLAARMLLAPREIPVGVITAVLGGPFFLHLLRRKSRGEKV